MVARLAFSRISSLMTNLLGFPSYRTLFISCWNLKLGWLSTLGRSDFSWSMPVWNSLSSKRGSINIRYMSWKAVSRSLGAADAEMPWLSPEMYGDTRTAFPASILGRSAPENPATPVFWRKSPKILSSKEGRSSVSMSERPPSM